MDSYSVSIKDATLIQKYIVDPSIYFYSRGIVKMKAILQHLWITGRFVLSGN